MYKRLALPSLLLTLTVGLTGCFSEPRLDATSLNKLNVSASDMIQSLPEQEGKHVAMLIQQAIIMTSDKTDAVLGIDLTHQSLKSLLNELTAQEVLRLEPVIERHMALLQETLYPRVLEELEASDDRKVQLLINEYHKQREKKRITLLTRELMDSLHIDQHNFFDNDKARLVLSNASSQTIGQLVLKMNGSSKVFTFDFSNAPLKPGEEKKEYVRSISLDINHTADNILTGYTQGLALMEAYGPDGTLIYSKDQELTQWMDHMDQRLNKLKTDVDKLIQRRIREMIAAP